MSKIISFDQDTVRINVTVKIEIAYKKPPKDQAEQARRSVVAQTFKEQAEGIEIELEKLINEKGLPNPLTN